MTAAFDCRGDAAAAVLMTDRLGLPACKLPPERRGVCTRFPEWRGERCWWWIFVPEERGEIVSTVTSWPEERRRVSVIVRVREWEWERSWGRVVERPLVVLWVGGVMTATATREVGREVWDMGRAGTLMSGSERVVKHIFLNEGEVYDKGQLGLMVMVCTCYDVVGIATAGRIRKKEKSCGIDVAAYREESAED